MTVMWYENPKSPRAPDAVVHSGRLGQLAGLTHISAGPSCVHYVVCVQQSV
jgi:hypothetical protein